MTKSSTIRKWSAGRKRQVFRGRTTKNTFNMIAATDVADVLGSISKREMRILAKRISKKVLETYQSNEFQDTIESIPEECAPQDISNLKIVEDWVFKSETVEQILDA